MMPSNPNKQRSMVESASLTERRGMISAHLSKELRQQYKRRSMAVRKGDEVKVIRGEHFGRSGAVTEVDTKKYVILVNGITVKRTVGTEKQVPLQPSNVVITSLNLDDNMRQRILLRKVKEVKVEKKQTPVAAPVTAAKAESPAEAKPESKEEQKPHAGHGQSRDMYNRSSEKKEGHEKKAPVQTKRTAPKNAAGKGGK